MYDNSKNTSIIHMQLKRYRSKIIYCATIFVSVRWGRVSCPISLRLHQTQLCILQRYTRPASQLVKKPRYVPRYPNFFQSPLTMGSCSILFVLKWPFGGLLSQPSLLKFLNIEGCFYQPDGKCPLHSASIIHKITIMVKQKQAKKNLNSF